MTIDPFLAGVLATIFSEIVIIFGAALYVAIKRVQRHD